MKVKSVDKKDILNFLKGYFLEDNSTENNIEIIETDLGYEIDLKDAEIIYVEEDKDLGWHCYGDVKDERNPEKIEEDIETFLEKINELYS